MPWEVKTGVAGCDGFAVTKKGESKSLGCHATREAAQRQVAALYAAEPSAYAKSLSDVVLKKTHNVLHGQELSGAVVELHHLIVDEMRSRGMEHENVDCRLHKAVVLKSEILLPMEKAKQLLKQQPTSTAVHVDSIMVGRKKKKKPLIDEEDVEKGDKPGHAFRGNQWTRGGGGGGSGGGGGGTNNERQYAYREEDEYNAAMERITQNGAVKPLAAGDVKNMDAVTASGEGAVNVRVNGIRNESYLTRGDLLAVNDRSGDSPRLRLAVATGVVTRRNPRMGEGKIAVRVRFGDGTEVLEMKDIVGAVQQGS